MSGSVNATLHLQSVLPPLRKWVQYCTYTTAYATIRTYFTSLPLPPTWTWNLAQDESVELSDDTGDIKNTRLIHHPLKSWAFPWWKGLVDEYCDTGNSPIRFCTKMASFIDDTVLATFSLTLDQGVFCLNFFFGSYGLFIVLVHDLHLPASDSIYSALAPPTFSIRSFYSSVCSMIDVAGSHLPESTLPQYPLAQRSWTGATSESIFFLFSVVYIYPSSQPQQGSSTTDTNDQRPNPSKTNDKMVCH